jgi:hypothetical protein
VSGIRWRERFAIAVALLSLTLAVAPDASAVPLTIHDPAGDSATPPEGCGAGCPDITAVHIGEAGGRIVVEVQSATPWGFRAPAVTMGGTSTHGAPVGVRMSESYPGPPPYERFLADPTRYVYRLDIATAFMRHYPRELRVRAAVVGPAPTPTTLPPEYDPAPDAGEATYVLDNRDGDVLPDLGDACPDGAESPPPTGWEEFNTTPNGCPALAPPFSYDAFVIEARKTVTALKARWRNARQRDAALRRGSITLPFRVPAGAAKVRLLVRRSTSSRTAVVNLGTRNQECRGGQCALKARVFARNVRKYSGKPFLLQLLIEVGGRRGVFAEYRSTVRMPAG